MSFSRQVKSELCRVPIRNRSCALAESCGVLLFASTFSSSEVRIVTESGDFSARLPVLFEEAFSARFAQLQERTEGGKYVFRVTSPDKLEIIWQSMGYDINQHFVLHLNYALLEEEHCRSSFLRGAFLAGGSVTDPRKRYHLEMTTAHLRAGGETEALLRDMGFEPKHMMRGGNTVIYYKHSETIEDILTTAGAPSSALEIMAAKVEKSMRNTVNRQVNCDAANLDKAIAASRAQVEALTRLSDSGKLKTLSAELQEAAVARLLHPELSLSELAETFDPPLTKSCLNHRMRKLVQLAKEN